MIAASFRSHIHHFRWSTKKCEECETPLELECGDTFLFPHDDKPTPREWDEYCLPIRAYHDRNRALGYFA